MQSGSSKKCFPYCQSCSVCSLLERLGPYVYFNCLSTIVFLWMFPCTAVLLTCITFNLCSQSVHNKPTQEAAYPTIRLFTACVYPLSKFSYAIEQIHPIIADTGRRQGRPWTSCQFIVSSLFQVKVVISVFFICPVNSSFLSNNRNDPVTPLSTNATIIFLLPACH